MVELKFELEGGDFSRAGYASSEVKKILKQLNVNSRVIKRVVVALYEAEVNVVAHAWRGNIGVLIETDRVVISLKDEGPGIEDIERAMQVGFSTATEKVRSMGFGAGMGLPNIKKNTDELTVESKVNKGTNVVFVNYL